jgi:hypothetical protein
MTTTVDVLVSNQGTIFTFTPLTSAAREWIEENVASEGWQWLGGSLCVEHRYASDLGRGMREANLELKEG